MWRLIFVAFVSHVTLAQNAYPNNFNQQWSSNSLSSSQWDNSVIVHEASYFVVSSRSVRPGQIYRVAATVYTMKHPITVRAAIQWNGVEVASDSQNVKKGITEVLLMRMPTTSVKGHYKLRVEGLYAGIAGGVAFANETDLEFSQRSMTIFIQTNKPIYKQGEQVNFRAIPITTELLAFNGIIDVYMLDPKKRIMKRWLSRQSNLGTVSLNYQLSDQPVFGNWSIRVIAQGQIEESIFLVEEYYQYRFEVNVTMAPFIFTTDQYIEGTVMANYTGGAPVHGNLSLKATVRPYRTSNLYIQDFSPISETYFYFDESFPFWFPQQKRESLMQVPHLTWFKGVYHFKYPIYELIRNVQTLENLEIQITATVGERFLDEVIEGYSIARFFNSSVKVFFIGSSPQVFKPTMQHTIYMGVSFHDGSPLSKYRIADGRLELNTEVMMKSGGRHTVNLNVSSPVDGIWTIKVDLRNQMGLLDSRRSNDVLKEVDHLRVAATFKDISGDRSYSELILMAYYSPSEHFLKVWTTTQDARVGEYILFHVQSNFNMEIFSYVIISKGNILLSSQETISSSIYTFAITLSAEMAPSATIVVYHVGKFGDVLADSLTFPVNGISRNNFTVFINNRKARTGEIVEVAIYGEPGAYVGLSAIDRPFYSLQLGNELTYAKVLSTMDQFDNSGNRSFLHTWLSHAGDPDDIVHLPSSSHGVDANQTFEFAGLVVFTDIVIPKKPYTYASNYSTGYWSYQEGPYFNATDLYLFRRHRFNRIQRHYDNVWLWKDINIGPHGRFIFEIPVPHRPAHWMITAFSMSQSFGFGMSQRPIEYMGVLPFFINVEMPTNSRQGEQIGVRVTVFNYMKNAIEALVLLEGSDSYKFVHVEEEGIVHSYNPKTTFGEHQFFVYIKAQDAVIVYLPIVPVRLGDVEVTVRATTLMASDKVTRVLHVESDGLPQYRHQSVLLDLTNRAYVFQYMHVNVTETPIIPYDIDRYYVYGSNRATISVCGDVVGPIFPTMPVNATSLLHMPMDGAEQVMFGFAAMMYTTMYMRLINVRNRTQEIQSFHYMNIHYQQLISFMNDDGSFSLFRSDWELAPKSVWLTSYCIRVLQEARFYEWENYLYIDPDIITKALTWLLLHQTEEGAFYEITWTPDRKANISVTVPNERHRNITLTAHVLITLATVKDVGSLGAQVGTAQRKAIQWLDQNLKLLNSRGDPYEIAIVAYALMLSKSENAEYAFEILARRRRSEGGLMYWSREPVPLPPSKLENQKSYLLPRLPYKYDSLNIETTAYALLVYTPRHNEEVTDGIVKWLNSQRLLDSGWESTQDSAITMKALIEYTNRDRTRDVFGLAIQIDATALKGQSKYLYVNRKNLAQLQKIEIPEAWGTVKVEAKGSGYAILQMSTQYNVDIAKFQTAPPVKAFSLIPRAHFYGRNQSHITYQSCQRWIFTDESPRSGMAVLDVAIPTGYIVQQQKLDAYVRGQNVRNLQRAKFLERKVVFYFDYLDDVDTCVRFTVERWLPVANMSRYLAIRVYDYYAPERFNETIFDALPTYLLNICEVCGSSQCPYCSIYNAAVRVTATAVFSLVLSLLVVFS